MHYRFLIYISHSYAIPIGLPLEKEIHNRDYTVKWFSDHEEGAAALGTKENTLFAIEEVLDYEPHIVLTITDNVADFINALKVQIFHGFNSEKRPEKNSEAHFRMRGWFDLYCTQGPSSTAVFKELEKKHGTFKIIETGWPKVDPLFPLMEKTRVSIPNIMIATTFTERLSLSYDQEVYDEIKRLSESGKYHFDMVMHPKIPDNIKEKWAELSNLQFTFHDTTDLVPLFKKADIMFADTTSAIQEFLLQIKPVVTYKHTIARDYLINVNEVSKIKYAIDEALNCPKELIENITAFVNRLHPYTDGKSSQRVVDATIQFLHAEKSGMKKKPLNLIRKLKIRKRLGFFTLKSYNQPFTLKREN